MAASLVNTIIPVSVYVTGLFNYTDTHMNNYPKCPFRQTPRNAATNELCKQAAILYLDSTCVQHQPAKSNYSWQFDQATGFHAFDCATDIGALPAVLVKQFSFNVYGPHSMSTRKPALTQILRRQYTVCLTIWKAGASTH